MRPGERANLDGIGNSDQEHTLLCAKNKTTTTKKLFIIPNGQEDYLPSVSEEPLKQFAAAFPRCFLI